MIGNKPAEKGNKIWFLSASVISYFKDPNKLKSGLNKKNEIVITCVEENQINLEDKVIYYAFERNLVLGLFKVVSGQKPGLDYNSQKIVYYDLERIPPIRNDKYLDVAKLSEQGLDKFEAFNEGILTTNLADKDQVKEIGEADYNKIKGYMYDDSLLSKNDIDEKKVTILSASLDFYGDRATSFAGLFVASIFGLVTLSAIIQSLNALNEVDLLIIHLSMIPFTVFAVAGWYTLQKYFHYGDIAERIRYYGLIYPYYATLREIKETRYTTNNGIKTSKKEDLVNCLMGLEKGHDTTKKDVMKAVKKWLLEKESTTFSLIYFVIIGLLGVIVYYGAFSG